MASSIRDVDLDDIEDVDEDDLSEERLELLENGYSDFDDVLEGDEPIRLGGTESPFEIMDGHHRIFIARQRGYESVPAFFEDLDDDDFEDEDDD